MMRTLSIPPTLISQSKLHTCRTEAWLIPYFIHHWSNLPRLRFPFWTKNIPSLEFQSCAPYPTPSLRGPEQGEYSWADRQRCQHIWLQGHHVQRWEDSLKLCFWASGNLGQRENRGRGRTREGGQQRRKEGANFRILPSHFPSLGPTIAQAEGFFQSPKLQPTSPPLLVD